MCEHHRGRIHPKSEWQLRAGSLVALDIRVGHYLKLLMDAIFGEGNFRNEIIWSYHRWAGATKHFQRMHDGY